MAGMALPGTYRPTPVRAYGATAASPYGTPQATSGTPTMMGGAGGAPPIATSRAPAAPTRIVTGYNPDGSARYGTQAGQTAATQQAQQQQMHTTAMQQLEQTLARQRVDDAKFNAEVGAQNRSSNSQNPAESIIDGTTIRNYGTESSSASASARSSAARAASAGSGADDGGYNLGEIQAFLNSNNRVLPRESPLAPPPPVSLGPPPSSRNGPSMAFSRAKDVSGRVGNQALNALKDVMTSRGMGGSGQEGSLAGGVLQDVARYQSDAEFKSALADDERQWDYQKENYAGGISQRAQDMGYGGDVYGGAVNQRGQDSDQQARILAMLPTLLAARKY